MADILITKKDSEPGSATLRVEVPVDRVRAAEAKAASQVAQRARLPGFRAGRAQLPLVRKRFQEAIRESVLRDVIGESWDTAVKTQQLKPIADPHIHDLKFEDGAPITFEFLVTVKPEITLNRLGGFALTRKVERVTDDMVNSQLDRLRGQRAPWSPIEGEKPQPGDLVQVTLATLEQGEPQDAKQYQLILGQGQAIPAVEDRILAMNLGETVDATVQFPDDFADESRRGQTRTVRITLHEVKRQQLPTLDDAFAAEVGDFASVEALRAAVRADLEADARREADADLRRQMIEQIVTANNLSAPRLMVDRATELSAEAYQVTREQFSRFASEFRPVADAQVKRELVIDYVVEQHKLKATEEELDQRIAEIAARQKAEPGQVYASLQKANRLKELERGITEQKVFDYLLKQSTVTDQ